MRTLRKLIEQNRAWAESIKETDPDFFLRFSRQQSPEYLWIGCSDSLVLEPVFDALDSCKAGINNLKLFCHQRLKHDSMGRESGDEGSARQEVVWSV